MPSPYVVEADPQYKALLSIATDTASETKAIENAVKADPPSLDNIKKAVAEGQKGVPEYTKTIEAAKKKLADLEKLKDPAAKTAAAKFKDALGKADKGLSGLKGHVDIAAKIADKAEKEDKATGDQLNTVLKAAEAASSDLNSFLIGFPGQIQLLRDNLSKVLAKKLPAQALKTSIPTVQKNLMEAGPHITTATSVHSNLGPLAKKAAAAYLPAVRTDGKEAATLEKKLAEQITKAKTMHAAGLKEINDMTAKAKTL